MAWRGNKTVRDLVGRMRGFGHERLDATVRKDHADRITDGACRDAVAVRGLHETLSPAERAFVKQYEKDNSGEKVVKIVLRPFEGEGKYKGRFTARFKKHGSMKEYEQGVHLIYAHGDCYYETFSSATTFGGATALGNITAIGNGTVSRDTSCDDLWPRIPQGEARTLLGGRREYARLLSNLEIRAMKPDAARIEAVRRHMATFADYTEAEMPQTSVALNTFAELAAIAGGDLVNAGRPKEALALWLKRGGCPEDVALVAEQILSLEALREMIDRHPWKPILHPWTLSCVERPQSERVWTVHCSRTSPLPGRFLIVNTAEEMCGYVRTIYAKRLMRAGRRREALPYFHRGEDYVRAVRYAQLAERFEAARIENPQASDVYCGLTLGAFLRQNADALFGTELEPDNMICNGRYPCVWAANNPAVAAMRRIPETNRFHYRWRTAEVYRRTADLAERAGDLSDARRLWGFCHAFRGLLLRYGEPKLAYDHLETVRRRLPELCRKFYRNPKDVGAPYDGWLMKDNWLGDDPLSAFSDVLPSVAEVPLPPHRETADDLMRVGSEIFEKTLATERKERECLSYEGAFYAFFRAGLVLSREGAVQPRFPKGAQRIRVVRACRGEGSAGRGVREEEVVQRPEEPEKGEGAVPRGLFVARSVRGVPDAHRGARRRAGESAAGGVYDEKLAVRVLPASERLRAGDVAAEAA